MSLTERLRHMERTLAEHSGLLNGDRLARIENKLDALLAALAEDEPEGETQPAAIDLDGNYPRLHEMPPYRSIPL